MTRAQHELVDGNLDMRSRSPAVNRTCVFHKTGGPEMEKRRKWRTPISTTTFDIWLDILGNGIAQTAETSEAGRNNLRDPGWGLNKSA